MAASGISSVSTKYLFFAILKIAESVRPIEANREVAAIELEGSKVSVDDLIKPERIFCSSGCLPRRLLVLVKMCGVTITLSKSLINPVTLSKSSNVYIQVRLLLRIFRVLNEPTM